MSLQEILDEIGADGWEAEDDSIDSQLICPHGDTIEQDGRCAEGCVSPLRTAGLI